MALLKRESQLDMVCAILHALRDRAGQVMLVSGETGIGKTVLVDAFTQSSCCPARVLRGACAPLFTLRPLVPFFEIAVQMQPAFAPLLNVGCDWRAAASVSLGWLQHAPPPTVLIMEDVHRADGANLDLRKYLDRRIRLPRRRPDGDATGRAGHRRRVQRWKQSIP